MSKITLSANASGTAVFTVAAPGTSTNQTLTLPDATGTVLSNADIASQAQAQAGTDNTTLMTPLRAAQSIAALAAGVNIQSFTASGTYTPTAGYSYAIGFVTGGGESSSSSGGGRGGAAGNTVIGVINLVSLAAQTITIGAGGLSTGSSPNAGGTSSVGALLSASGGGQTVAFTGLVQIRGANVSNVTSSAGGGSFWGGGGPAGATGSPAIAYGAGAGGTSTSGNAAAAGIAMIVEFK